MIRISGIRVPEGSDREHVKKKAAHILRVKPEDIRDFKVLKRSVDARKRNGINEVYTVSLSVDDEKRIVRKCGRDDVVLTEEKIYELPRLGEADVDVPRPGRGGQEETEQESDNAPSQHGHLH